ncbi:MAG: hypothetical protein K0S29_862 [Gammaproteobacteria bacterium]|jgi:hypothetical protein|nr:hypothetical protein [Gammaproteobacteria bacterium]
MSRKVHPLTEQNKYQSAGAVALDSAAAVSINVALGSLLGIAGALKNAPEVALRMLPGLGSAVNYIMASRFLAPLIHPQLHAYKVSQLRTILGVSEQDAEDLLAQKKAFTEIRRGSQEPLTYEYMYAQLNHGDYSMPMAEIKQLFPEQVSRRYHTAKLTNFGYETCRIAMAVGVSCLLPLDITHNEAADGVIKGAVAMTATDLAVAVVKGLVNARAKKSADDGVYRALSAGLSPS